MRGVVTSTSLMVTGRAAAKAAAMSRDCPKLSIGLHWDVWGEADESGFPIDDTGAVRDEFARQLETFHRLMGRMPTHIDSHRHAHTRTNLFPVFRELVQPLGLPLRYSSAVRYIDSFYAQWEWLVTQLENVSVSALDRLLRQEIGEGWTELACHPGYVTTDFHSVYLAEREAELSTLTDPRIRATIDAEAISLMSYADYLSMMPTRPDSA